MTPRPLRAWAAKRTKANGGGKGSNVPHRDRHQPAPPFRMPAPTFLLISKNHK